MAIFDSFVHEEGGVGEANRIGVLASWYRELQEPRGAARRRGPLPHLGVGAGLLTIIVSSYFADQIAGAVAVIVAYGPHAFFAEGLRIADWKHGILSNGAYLSFAGALVRTPGTLVLWAAAIFGADIAAMLIQRSARTLPWLKNLLRVLGGAALLLFAGLLYRQHYPPIHPIPLSALIGGVVLVWKAISSVARRDAPQSPR